ncbi:unnamed protein product [Urochloa humidicola]
MDEDDLLGEDEFQGRDLRHQLRDGGFRREGHFGANSRSGWSQEGRRSDMRDDFQEHRPFNQRGGGDQRGDNWNRSGSYRGGGMGNRGAYQPRGTRAQGDPRVSDLRNHGDQRGQDGNRSGATHEETRRPDQEGHKDQRKEKFVRQSKSDGTSKSDIKCFRCTEIGHHQLECTNDPVCYKCKKVGHMAAECDSIHQRKMKMFGFGIPGQGFYSIELPEKKEVDSFNAILVILEGNANEGKIAAELKNIVRADWDFQVKQAAVNEFRTVFPDQSSIDTLSKLSKFKLPLYGIKVKVISSKIDPAASSVLQTTWIKIYGIPDFAREEDVIKEVASLAGEPVKVDDFSLLRVEPVRVRINCRNPAEVRGVVEIFFNGVDREIKFVAEGTSGKGQAKGGGPPGLGK